MVWPCRRGLVVRRLVCLQPPPLLLALLEPLQKRREALHFGFHVAACKGD